jgi:hypothetical protein
VFTLAADGLDPIDLDDQSEGYVCESWALGPPTVRDVVEPRTLANGTIDWTSYVAARSLTMTVCAFPTNLTVQGQIDRLRAFCRPDLRPTLTWTFESDPPRMVYLRANPGLDVEFSNYSYSYRRVGLSFVVPDGLQWATDLITRRMFPASDADIGRRYNEMTLPAPDAGGATTGRDYDRTYPYADPTNIIVVNPGAISVPWSAVIYGPCTGPELWNDTSGEVIALTANGGISLSAGETVVVDQADRTIRQDGISRYDRFDIARSDWWPLYPGENRLHFQPATFGPGSMCELTWRSAWL